MKSGYIEPTLLKAWLRTKKLDTARSLSDHAGISTQAAYAILTGMSEPSAATLTKLGLRIVYTEVK